MDNNSAIQDKFDIIIPLGESCTITWLLNSSHFKKETTLFEWFITNSLLDIVNVINNIINEVDTPILKIDTGINIFMNNTNIRSTHYTVEEYLPIFKRRAKRLYDAIKNNNRILFIRFVRKMPLDADEMTYTYEDISKFVSVIEKINPDTSQMKLLKIHQSPDKNCIQHPFIIYKYYEELDVSDDNLKSSESDITNAFIKMVNDVGYLHKEVNR
jgi:hypothetical protein